MMTSRGNKKKSINRRDLRMIDKSRKYDNMKIVIKNIFRYASPHAKEQNHVLFFGL